MSSRLKVMLIWCCLWPAISCAGEKYGDHPAAQQVIDELVVEENFDRASLQAVFAEAERQESILEAISRPAEKAKPWYEYREIFLTPEREKEGVVFYNKYRDTLEQAERETGVPAEVIVAIIGVETYYGRITGKYRVIDALTTLAFEYPRRSEFFTSELKHYLVLTRDQGIDPLVMKGSYAGAMGFGQFMPSSYRAYAIDFDDDELIDIWENPVDAIGSVANYFKEHGWQPGETVVVAAQAGPDAPGDMFVQGRKGLKPEHTVAQFTAAGILPAQELPPDEMATAMKFELPDGQEYWLGLHNFYVITRYNHSAMYAMCVHQLSQRLAALIAG
ncbi:MAG: lytic murein transglycosylase B [Pseudomonadota bacterium]